MISRHWKGTTKPGLAETYIQHLKSEIFPKLQAIPGFLSASILRRDVSNVSEFQVVTLWESLSAIRSFAGDDHETAVVPEAARAMILRFDRRVEHYEVAGSVAPGPRGDR
jgi:heme-degrading monooxygenase HmoA